MEYISTKEAAAKWGISTTRITILANEGRIPGAKRIGRNWMIPASATKPVERKPHQSKVSKDDTSEANDFSFPLYHFRADWNPMTKTQLSKQQQLLLTAETAVLECRFADAYPLLTSILNEPDDIVTEIGCLWNTGICCVAMNKSDEFSRIFLRLKLLLSALLCSADCCAHCSHCQVLLLLYFYRIQYSITSCQLCGSKYIERYNECIVRFKLFYELSVIGTIKVLAGLLVHKNLFVFNAKLTKRDKLPLFILFLCRNSCISIFHFIDLQFIMVNKL